MPLSAKSAHPLPTEDEEFVEPPAPGMRIGIAFSGGGIRSAAFNLGALQALQERQVLQRSEYLAAVSGGNYIASALMISSAYSEAAPGDKKLWAHGSPEERYLRQHTDYLAPGWVGRVWLGLSVLYGFLLNYLPFLLGAFLVGRLCGWLIAAAHVRLADLQLTGMDLPPSTLGRALAGVVAALILLSLVLVAVRRLHDGRGRSQEYGESRSEPTAAGLVTAAAGIVAFLALPTLAAQYAAASRWLLAHVRHGGSAMFDTTAGRVEVAVLWLLGTLVVAVVTVALSHRLHARALLLLLSCLAGSGLLLVPLLSSMEHAARRGFTGVQDVAGGCAALAVLAVLSVTVHNRRYSLHLLYRERLNSAFALERRRRSPERPAVAEPIPYSRRILLSDVGAKARTAGVPTLVVCCAANLTSDEVPSGRFAESFTFEDDRSGCPLFGYHDTRVLEGPAGSRLTLPSIMAVSGAALSPVMGRYTYPPLRFLMALMNVRLGVWVPNPLHPAWPGLTGGGTARRGWQRVWHRIRAGWLEPGALYVMREALGTLRAKHRYIYLTDGGHWENLGLVELLRRRCTHVLCFDASSDRTGDGQDLGRAIAMARSELGVEITIDPRPTMGDGTKPPEAMAVRGSMRYAGRTDEGRLVYAKGVLPDDASWDLHAFRRRDGVFPHHPTSRQIFTDEQFEAYRSLGHAAASQAVDLLNPPWALVQPDGAASDGAVPDGARARANGAGDRRTSSYA